jgi:hypothetical protein
MFDWLCWIPHVFLLTLGWLPLGWLYNFWSLNSLPRTLSKCPIVVFSHLKVLYLGALWAYASSQINGSRLACTVVPSYEYTRSSLH